VTVTVTVETCPTVVVVDVEPGTVVVVVEVEAGTEVVVVDVEPGTEVVVVVVVLVGVSDLEALPAIAVAEKTPSRASAERTSIVTIRFI
jgi:hypothetical protein